MRKRLLTFPSCCSFDSRVKIYGQIRPAAAYARLYEAQLVFCLVRNFCDRKQAWKEQRQRQPKAVRLHWAIPFGCLLLVCVTLRRARHPRKPNKLTQRPWVSRNTALAHFCCSGSFGFSKAWTIWSFEAECGFAFNVDSFVFCEHRGSATGAVHGLATQGTPPTLVPTLIHTTSCGSLWGLRGLVFVGVAAVAEPSCTRCRSLRFCISLCFAEFYRLPRASLRQTRVRRNGLGSSSVRPPLRASRLADGQVRATAHFFRRGQRPSPFVRC